MHPPGSVDQALLAKIAPLAMAQRDTQAGPLKVTLNGQAASVLLAYSAPVGGQCLCALALVGDVAAWDDEVRATAHAVAAIVATQIRHANDMTALAERQKLTSALIAGAPVAVLAMDAEGRLVEFNPAAERLSGYRRQDVLGQPMSELLVPERHRPRFLEHIRTYLATGDPGEFTGQIRVPTLHADGTERITELTPVQIMIGGQAIFTGFLRDITEVERSHAALADQTERLNCLIASAIPGVLITDEKGTVTNVSESFGEMFGLAEPSSLCGMSAVSVVRRIERVFADPVGFSRRIAAVVRARQPLTGEQTQAADGRTIESDYWPVLVDGVHRGDIWLAWDMSDRSQVEQQRLEAQRRLHRAERAAAQARRGQEPVPRHRVARAAYPADVDRLVHRADQGRGRRPVPPRGSGSWTSSSATPTGCTGSSATCSCWTGSRPARCRWTWPRSRWRTSRPRRSGRRRPPRPSRASPSTSGPGPARPCRATSGG